ncbi:hypothetical protein HPB47_022398 [Ixodes persulcatus]|uniref:Uncharacterized protein n=1 Tax=Ixodes persulcatus TaxID=34615 RepID=A0AC60QD56_IXOPE|nr:hypothetical protein HPB47_022398 [Ixodes persulcatus]
MDDIEVKEGYLCPICVKDLGTIEELTAHFEAAHSAEEKDVLQSLKGLIGRAKRKILKEKDLGDSRAEEDDNGPDSFSRLNWDYQEIGATQRHTEAFRSIRSQRVERYVSQTNKLLIRLGKLLSDAPADPEKRKAHEKSIVPWIQDGDVKLCPGCAKPFNLSRRRHHCRLCGGIMCHVCSQFLDFALARKLMNLTALSTPRSSVAGPSPETSLRVCRDCLHLLNRRDQLRDQGTPKLVVMYQKMKQSMDEAEHILPQYYKIIDSLHNGQTSHTLEEAQMLRVQLTKIAERVDLLSRQIGALGSEEGGGPSPRALQLQGGVRLAASHFLRQWLLGLPGPPSPEELQRLQGARREQLQQQIQRDKASALQAQRRSDPMVVQMGIIRGYIRQARESRRYDEVAILEANLKELKREYMNMTLGQPPGRES